MIYTIKKRQAIGSKLEKKKKWYHYFCLLSSLCSPTAAAAECNAMIDLLKLRVNRLLANLPESGEGMGIGIAPQLFYVVFP